jgi:hypothetical protein
MTEQDPVLADVNAMEHELGIEPGFLERLYKEDDWSFVIKTHAVLEAAVAHLLTAIVGVPSLQRLFARLELSGSTLGKVAVAKDLDLLDERDRRFIRSFSELRNDLVHDIRYVNFTFAAHVAAMDEAHVRQFTTKFDAWSDGASHEVAGKKIPLPQFFRDNPKLAIWYSAMVTIAIVYGIKKVRLDARKELREAERWSGFMEFAAKVRNELAQSPVPPIATLDGPMNQAESTGAE